MTDDSDDLEAAQAALSRKDIATAIKLLLPLADAGIPEASHELGFIYHTGEGVKQDKQEGLKWYRRAADKGHAPSQYTLGILDWGDDPFTSVSLLRNAAAQGHVLSQFFLGNKYRSGAGVKPDPSEAFKWMQKAAEHGLPEAQTNLGVMYLWGSGVPQNYEEAYFWLSLACERLLKINQKGREAPLERRDEAAIHLDSQQLSSLMKRMSEWHPLYTQFPP